MGQNLNIEVSEEVFEAIKTQAELAGVSPSRWIADTLEHQLGGERTIDKPFDVTRTRLESLFGAADLGRPTGSDNEKSSWITSGDCFAICSADRTRS